MGEDEEEGEEGEVDRKERLTLMESLCVVLKMILLFNTTTNSFNKASFSLSFHLIVNCFLKKTSSLLMNMEHCDNKSLE
jgi:hypothetical protein